MPEQLFDECFVVFILVLGQQRDFVLRNFHIGQGTQHHEIGEIDIVGIDTANGNLVLGECKYTTSPKGLSVLHTLQEKSEAMLKLTQTKNVQYILFSTAGFTQGLIDEAGKNPNIKLIERL